MASGDDFFQQLKQANDKLSDLAPLRTDVEQLSNIVSTSLGQLVTLTTYTDQALFQNALQNGAIICILEKISKQTCELLNQSCLQTALQTQIEKNTAAIADIVAVAHPEAALFRERQQALRSELEKCCPPVKPKPCCHYEPCQAPPQIDPPPAVVVIE
jgi:DNA-binding NarL/FixJ family response regulator